MCNKVDWHKEKVLNTWRKGGAKRHGKPSENLSVIRKQPFNEYKLVQFQLMAYKKVHHYQRVKQETLHDGQKQRALSRPLQPFFCKTYWWHWLQKDFYHSECSSEHCWVHNPEVERTQFDHKPAPTRCSSQDFWQRSENNYQKTCPRAKDRLWRAL